MNEFRRLFDAWTDPEYLRLFFKSNVQDLNSGFYGTLTVDQAITETIEDAYDLQMKILSLAKKQDNEGLINLFKPLHLQERVFLFSDRKAYGTKFKSWLRIYALKTLDDAFLITGGAIKLTRTMNHREHTLQELAKIERCKDFLKDEGIYDQDGLQEFELSI